MNANPKTYPTIGWLKFSEYCQQWKLLDNTLTSQDVDLAFVAVNYEEVDLEQNDDKNLVRYEFLEIFVRLAKVKFFDKKVYPTLGKSLKVLIEDYILKNNIEQMTWREFRVNQVWTIEVDQILKANWSSVDDLYYYFAG